MTDRELLELAAKAAGYVLPSADDHDEIGRQYDYHLGLWVKHHLWGWFWFRPHIDDGQALRLAVKLHLTIEIWAGSSHYNQSVTIVEHDEGSVEFPHDSDPYAATRLAIVRAAAEIGKAMK